MKTSPRRARVGLAGAALGLLAVLAVPATAQAGDAPTMTAAPNPALAGQTVTISPTSVGCDGDHVDLAIINEATDGEMDPSVALNSGDSSDDMWSYQIAFDAGTYLVEATCTSPPAKAGHLGVGFPAFDYADLTIVVNGKTDAPATATTGQTISIANLANSKCVTQSVLIGVHNPDGTTTPLGPPVVDADGNWSVPFTFPVAGTYDVQGACAFNQTDQLNAGHLAVQGTNAVFFNYLPGTMVVTDPTVVVPETPPATPVVAAANFTG